VSWASHEVVVHSSMGCGGNVPTNGERHPGVPRKASLGHTYFIQFTAGLCRGCKVVACSDGLFTRLVA